LRDHSGRVSRGEPVQRLVKLALDAGPSIDGCGCWRRHKGGVRARGRLSQGVCRADLCRHHHPALELLTYHDGSRAGAAGYTRLERRPWTIRSAATVLATGGCAFRSGLMGSHTNTGDGHLMAAEAGAELSGMDFSVIYTLSPAWCSTGTLPYAAARFFAADGVELDIPPPMSDRAHHETLAKAILAGPVFADLSEAPEALKPILRRIRPATVAPFERRACGSSRTASRSSCSAVAATGAQAIQNRWSRLGAHADLNSNAVWARRWRRGPSASVMTSTLRDLEENGFVSRTVTPATPPQVE